MLNTFAASCEARCTYILKAYRKDMERLEQLQRYAEGLEEENGALQKQLKLLLSKHN